MANREVGADRALMIGLVHEVFPDETFQDDVMAFCRHLAKQNPEQMGMAKLAIEMVYDVGLAQARNVERMANAALMMEPSYREGVTKYLQGIGTSRK
jgi:enoyl-CoA hydratase/carnithine racemase